MSELQPDEAGPIANRELLLKEALDHSWRHFSLYANQRMQALNYFLATSGFLSAGFGAATNADAFEVGLGIAVVGMLATIVFALLDLRNKELVDAAERPMKHLEGLLSETLDIKKLRIIERTDRQTCFLRTYRTIVPALHSAIFLAFVAALVFSIYQLAT